MGKYSKLTYAFTENVKIMSVHLSKLPDGLVVNSLKTDRPYLYQISKKTYVLYNYQMYAFFFKIKVVRIFLNIISCIT